MSRFWQRRPSGKQSLPVPSLVSRPQSRGKSSSFPVACGDCVPSSVNLPPPPKIPPKSPPPRPEGLKMFLKKSNWPSTKPEYAAKMAKAKRTFPESLILSKVLFGFKSQQERVFSKVAITRICYHRFFHQIPTKWFEDTHTTDDVH